MTFPSCRGADPIGAQPFTTDCSPQVIPRCQQGCEQSFLVYLKCLILGGKGDLRFDCKMGEELPDLGSGHLLRMPFVGEEDETADPFDVGLFGSKAVMLYP